MYGYPDPPGRRHAAELIGRRAECAVLDQLTGSVLSGESRALVVHGEPGVGKTALLDYVAARAPDFRVLRGNGIQSEMELPFAGLHQLCAPLLGRLDGLPAPQREALRTAFGISAGPAPDKFLIGLAVLGLLSTAAQEQPLMCVLDDLQWLDGASAQVLAFVARRLGAESIGLVFATRLVTGDLYGLPELAIGRLRPADAGALLDTVLTGPVEARIRELIISETRGNPLALLELPRWLTPAELAGGFGIVGAKQLPGNVEESFGNRIDILPEPARLLLLTAASDSSGDSALVWRAASRLGIEADAITSAFETGLVELGARVRFRHPSARSAVYRSASEPERRRVHGALAEVTDPRLDPDRRAWHRARAASGPDEDVAAELERAASRARARGGLPAAAAFLQRAATLTPDPAERATRALAGAETHLRAGTLDAALSLLAMAEAGPLSDFQRARADLIRAELAFVTNRGRDAPPLLLKAAERLATIDAGLSRATYLDALSAAIFADRLATPAGDAVRVARAAETAPAPPDGPRASDLLLDGTAAFYNRGYVSALPILREALAHYGAGLSAAEELHWLWLAGITAMQLVDDARWDVLSARHLELARRTGALSELPLALTTRALFLVMSGDLAAAAALADEAQAIKDATGISLAPYGALGLAAFRGDEAMASELLRATIEDVTSRGEGVGITMAEWAHALLCNGLGRYHDAVSAAQRSMAHEPVRGSLILPCVELIEAAARSAQTRLAAGAYRRLAEVTSASGTDWALGLQARSKALLSDGDEAEANYREAIDRLGRTRLRVDLARARLLHGEWLRRAHRHAEAREQLRAARTEFETMGMAGFAGRVRRELRATGRPVRKRAEVSRYDELTAQEARIARMARDGLSNPEIASRLLVSPHTVQYHLRKVFTKLGITSRSHLEEALPAGQDVGPDGVRLGPPSIRG